MATESFGFQAEISQLLDLIISEQIHNTHYSLSFNIFLQTPSTLTRRSSFVKLSRMVLTPLIKFDMPR